MPENRFFLKQSFQAQARVLLTGDELHHFQVLKPKKGELFELVNGQNELAKATLLNLNTQEAIFQIEEVQTGTIPKTRIILAQGFIKPAKLDLVLEKGTELGVDEFVFFPGQLSEIETLSENKQARAASLLISALKQSGRLILPKITLLKKLSDYAYTSQNYFGSLDPEAPLLSSLLFSKEIKEKTLACFIGPEKGFTKEEEKLMQTKFQAKGVSLSKNILRTETAGIVACAFLAAIRTF